MTAPTRDKSKAMKANGSPIKKPNGLHSPIFSFSFFLRLPVSLTCFMVLNLKRECFFAFAFASVFVFILICAFKIQTKKDAVHNHHVRSPISVYWRGAAFWNYQIWTWSRRIFNIFCSQVNGYYLSFFFFESSCAFLKFCNFEECSWRLKCVSSCGICTFLGQWIGYDV